MLKAMLDTNVRQKQCGFRAMLMFNHRYDTQTPASNLRLFLEVVSPPPIKGPGDVVAAVGTSEAKLARLAARTVGTAGAQDEDGDRRGDAAEGVARTNLAAGIPNWDILGHVETSSWGSSSYEDCRDYV